MFRSSQSPKYKILFIAYEITDHINEICCELKQYGCQFDLALYDDYIARQILLDRYELIAIYADFIAADQYEFYCSIQKLQLTHNIPIVIFGSIEDVEILQLMQISQCEFVSISLSAIEIGKRILSYLNPNPNQCALTDSDLDLGCVSMIEASTQQRILKRFAEYTQSSIVITDASPELNIVYVNPIFEKLTGYAKHEVLGRSPKLLQGPKTDRSITAKIRASIQNATPLKVELLNYKKNSDEVWVEISLFPIFENHGQLTHWVALNRDISEDINSRTQLESERKLAKLRSQFILMMSHESRTHLSTILSSIDLLERYSHCVSSSEKTELYAQVRDAVDRLVGMFSDVLLLEHSTEDYVAFKPALLDLKKFCEKLVSEVRKIIPSGHQIHLDFDARLSKIIADESLLYHIFSNLLTNAVKYSPEGGIIKFDVVLAEELIIFQVQDQGIGIPEAAMPQLFQSFFRADNVGGITGTGLGLSIVKKMVEKHQGQIECNSEVGVGTIFRVIVPKVDALEDNTTISAHLQNCSSP